MKWLSKLKILVTIYKNRKVLAEMWDEMKDVPVKAIAMAESVKRAMADGKLKESEKNEIADKNMALLTEIAQVVAKLYEIKL